MPFLTKMWNHLAKAPPKTSLFRILHGPFCEVPPLWNHHLRVSSLSYKLLSFFPLAPLPRVSKNTSQANSHLSKKNPTLWYIARDRWCGKADVTNRFVGIDWDDNLHLSHCHRRTFQCLLQILCHSSTTFYLGDRKNCNFLGVRREQKQGQRVSPIKSCFCWRYLPYRCWNVCVCVCLFSKEKLMMKHYSVLQAKLRFDVKW